MDFRKSLRQHEQLLNRRFYLFWLFALFTSFSSFSFFYAANASPAPAGSWAAIFTSLMAHSSPALVNNSSEIRLENLDLHGKSRTIDNDARIAQLHRIAAAYRTLNPRREHLRYFVGYPCAADEPFKCLFSHCMTNTTGTCGCRSEADEALFLGLFCLPTRALGETCVAHEQCAQKVTGSECARLASQTEVGHCICGKGYFIDPSSSEGSMRCVRNEAAMESPSASDNSNFVSLLGEPGQLSSFFSVRDFERRRQRNRHRCVSDQQCMQNGQCSTSSGQCECRSGFELGENKRECLDIDECSLRTAADGHELPPACLGTIGYAQCINTVGSYECRCVGNATKGRLGGKAPDGVCCGANEIPCDVEAQCVRIDHVCDGFADCSNAYDEMFSFCFPNVNTSISSSNHNADASDGMRQLQMSLTVSTTETSSPASSQIRTLPASLVFGSTTPLPRVYFYKQPIRFEPHEDEWSSHRIHFPVDKTSRFPYNFKRKTALFKFEPTLTARLNLRNAENYGNFSNGNISNPEHSFTNLSAVDDAAPNELDQNMDELFLASAFTGGLVENSTSTRTTAKPQADDDHWASSPGLVQSLQLPSAPSVTTTTTTNRIVTLQTTASSLASSLPSSTILSAKLHIRSRAENSDAQSFSDYEETASRDSRTSRRNNNQHYLVENAEIQRKPVVEQYRNDLGIWIGPASKIRQAKSAPSFRYKRQVINSAFGGMEKIYPLQTSAYSRSKPNPNFLPNIQNNIYVNPGKSSFSPSLHYPKIYGIAASTYGNSGNPRRLGSSSTTSSRCRLWKWFASVTTKTKNIPARKRKNLPLKMNYLPSPPPVADFYTAADNPLLSQTNVYSSANVETATTTPAAVNTPFQRERQGQSQIYRNSGWSSSSANRNDFAGEVPESFVEQEARRVATDFANVNHLSGPEHYFDALLNDEQNRRPQLLKRSFFADRTAKLDTASPTLANDSTKSAEGSELRQEKPERFSSEAVAESVVKNLAPVGNKLAENKENATGSYFERLYEPSHLTIFNFKRPLRRNKVFSNVVNNIDD